jgi:hypothetical protein
VDPALAMLEQAKLKPDSNRVTWIDADAASFSLAARFDLVVMSGFQVFLEDEHGLSVLKNIKGIWHQMANLLSIQGTLFFANGLNGSPTRLWSRSRFLG